MIKSNLCWLRAFLSMGAAICLTAVTTCESRAADVTWTIDSSQSYLTFSIPNFSLSGLNINITGQNPATGAPVSTPWNAATGNTTNISGTFMSDIGGPGTSVNDVAAGNLPNVTFLENQSSMSAGISGLYRPNPAAWTGASTNGYLNNAPQFGNYGNTIHTQLGNAAVTGQFATTYNIASSTLPVVAGSFSTNFSGTQGLPLQGPAVGTGTGVLFQSSYANGGLYAVQGSGFSLFLVGPSPIPDLVLPTGYADQLANHVTPGTIQFGGVEGGIGGLNALGLGNLITPSSGSGSLSVSAGTASVLVPLSIPFVLNVAAGVQINGVLTGQVVAHSAVPEPSTVAMAGTGGLFALAALVRRRRQLRTRQ